MTPLLTALIVGLAAAGIFALRPVTAKIKTVFHSNPVVNTQIKFQSLQLVLTAIVLLLTYFLNPENFMRFFRMGDVNVHISKIAWLGVTGNETWLEIATSIGLYHHRHSHLHVLPVEKSRRGLSLLSVQPALVNSIFDGKCLFRRSHFQNRNHLAAVWNFLGLRHRPDFWHGLRRTALFRNAQRRGRRIDGGIPRLAVSHVTH